MVWEESTATLRVITSRGIFLQAIFAARIPLPILPTPRGLFQHAAHRVVFGADFRWNRADISTDRAGNCHNGSLRLSMVVTDQKLDEQFFHEGSHV
jgi:hypothetical protein